MGRSPEPDPLLNHPRDVFMVNIKNNCSSQETQRRLLEAAGEVFAEHGFHSATIKEITDRAGASVASVNYHFNDKAELYNAVMRRITDDAIRIIPPPESLQGDAGARFRLAVRHVTATMLGRGKPAWERVLMAREFARPTPALAAMFSEVCEPLNRVLSGIISELTGLPQDDQRVGLAAASTFAQCVYHLHHQGHIEQLHPQLASRPGTDVVADQIAAFSLAGLASLRKG